MTRTRREALKLGLATAAAWAAPHALWAAEALGKKIPLALQLYSVRNDCQKDLPAVLAAVAKMGYVGVEFAGYYGRNAEELRKLLDANGLKCCGTHIPLNTIVGDALKGTVAFNKTLGNPFLIVSSLPKTATASRQTLLDTAKQFDEAAERVKGDGLRVGYHAHGGDFKPVEGLTPWDAIFGNTKPAVTMQLDIGNCIGGGGDPIAVLKKYPGRSATIHLKEHGGPKGAPVGAGAVKWSEVFELCETSGKTEWYIVEHESYAEGTTPLESVKQCIDNLRKMGK